MNRGELLQTGIKSTKKQGRNDHWRAYTIERNKYKQTTEIPQKTNNNKANYGQQQEHQATFQDCEQPHKDTTPTIHSHKAKQVRK